MNLDWIKSIDNYIDYFNDDQQIIIRLIGINNYLKLHEHFQKTGIYFPARSGDNYSKNDSDKIVEIIGRKNYDILYKQFQKGKFYFSNAPIIKLKKIWVIKNWHIDYNEAARIVNVSIRSVYNWRREGCMVK